MNNDELRALLEAKTKQYNNPRFISDDPILVVHRFSKKEDIEIIGILAATIAWGNRLSIIRSANRLVETMEGAPHHFLLNHQPGDLKRLENFVHRTFNASDLLFFISALQSIYRDHGGLHEVFTRGFSLGNQAPGAIAHFRKVMLAHDHLPRSAKHISDPMSNSAAKRLNMYLRWMVRKDDAGVDFGLWTNINPALLSIPLDVHTGNVARKLGLLTRIQNDQRAVQELDTVLRSFDPDDPVKYDFALFGMGAMG